MGKFPFTAFNWRGYRKNYAVPDNRSVHVLAGAKTAESYADCRLNRQRQCERNIEVRISVGPSPRLR